MTQIICLANSWKHGERCIAGINPETRKWIRPVSNLDDGRVPKSIRLINGEEPTLLDIIEIPLAEDGPDFGFESENRLITSGQWQRLGKVQPTDVIQYCINSPYILHNHHKYLTVSCLQSKSLAQRRTLQLVQAKEFFVSNTQRENGANKWKVTLVTCAGIRLKDATITDPIFVQKLETGYRPQTPCLATVSLSMPHIPWESWEGSPPCWKLIVGVIELEA